VGWRGKMATVMLLLSILIAGVVAAPQMPSVRGFPAWLNPKWTPTYNLTQSTMTQAS
jgi:hypothetical protein